MAEAVARAADDSQHPNVDFTRLGPFPWDTLHVFGAYTPPTEIDKELGFHWPGASDSLIQAQDTVALVVFVKDGMVVQWIDFPINRGRFAPTRTGIPRQRAIFRFAEHYAGVRSLEPAIPQ
jgi:hypothetical protein